MSGLQEQAVQMIGNLSDYDVQFLIEIIRRLMPPKIETNTSHNEINEGIEAFYRLKAAQEEIKQYLPDNFDPEQELEEALAERYGDIR
ncbi:MAG: hypothetical protein HFG50_07955 [Lachnospiraceae bacterium]|jgi:hypothetical protein|nr:hypothetical protein [Lachnospiraceae bacterium]